ncbi:hypothetical protein [Candidatus Solirubrobacter pratensis]|uniref:hypothetical protein n=1 Tax=Candidatus Solirubrobacter pratensis TaxID=1298857 RepID=UPI0004238842|nr:hypothetical protein [Candidatus Solirubrobacter pratensis]
MPSRAYALLLVAGALCLLAAGFTFYGRHTVLDEQAFAARATGTLAQDEVRDEIAARIAGRLVEAHPGLAELRPVLDAAAADIVATPRFAQEFRRGAARMHHTLFADSHSTVQFVLPGAGEELSAAVENHSESAARTVPDGDPDLLAIGGGRLETTLRRIAPAARSLAGLALPALAAGIVLLGLAVRRAPTRRRGLRGAAMAVAAIGGATLAAVTIARSLLLATFDTSHGDAVVGTIWSAYLGDLRLWAVAVGAIGLILAATAEPGTPGAWRRVLARVAHPERPGARLARAGALLLVAILLLTAPEVPVNLGIVGLAGLLVFTAAAEVARLRPARRSADY